MTANIQSRINDYCMAVHYSNSDNDSEKVTELRTELQAKLMSLAEGQLEGCDRLAGDDGKTVVYSERLIHGNCHGYQLTLISNQLINISHLSHGVLDGLVHRYDTDHAFKASAGRFKSGQSIGTHRHWSSRTGLIQSETIYNEVGYPISEQMFYQPQNYEISIDTMPERQYLISYDRNVGIIATW